MKEVKNDLSKVRFTVYKPNGMRFNRATIQQLSRFVDQSYRKDKNKRKPTTLLKENGWTVTTRIWNNETRQFEIPSTDSRRLVV